MTGLFMAAKKKAYEVPKLKSFSAAALDKSVEKLLAALACRVEGGGD